MGADREKNEQASLPTSGPSQLWCSHGMRAAAAAVRTDKGTAVCRVVFTFLYSRFSVLFYCSDPCEPSILDGTAPNLSTCVYEAEDLIPYKTPVPFSLYRQGASMRFVRLVINGI
jgi:hypothetical protein